MIKNISKSEWLKNQLLEEIRTGVYRPGDVLPSVRHLARRFDVSKHTVSQALSNLHELKILEITQGKATRLRNSPFRKHIEIVYFGSGTVDSQSFWADVYQGISAEAENYDDYDFSQTTFRNLNSYFFPGNFDSSRTVGMLVLGMSHAVAYRDFLRFGIPMLSIHDYSESSGVPHVRPGIGPVFREAAELFRRSGRRRVAVFSFWEHQFEGIDHFKLECARDTFLRAGIMPDASYALAHEDKDSGGYVLLHRLVRAGKTPDGLFLASDAMALGAYRAAYELNLRIPEDLAILGCDNLNGSGYMVPSLSSIELHRGELGRTGFRTLVEYCEGKGALNSVDVPAELVLRESFP